VTGFTAFSGGLYFFGSLGGGQIPVLLTFSIEHD
jgi:hypothetical protein